MQNLYELKKEKQLALESVDRGKRTALIAEYSKDHDWEIGYQKYYSFLINDFYNYIIGFLNDYGKGYINEYVHCDLVIPCETIPFVRDFLNRYKLGYLLGNINPDYLGVRNLGCLTGRFDVIKFYKNVHIDQINNAFYEELQRVESTMKSQREMDIALEIFKQNNNAWLWQKRKDNEIKKLENNLNSVSLDIDLDNYYNLLEQLYNWAISNMKTSRARNKKIQMNFEVNDIHEYYDESTNTSIYEPILQLIIDYHIGYFGYDAEKNTARVTIEATPQRIYDVYMMEMQRLSYYKEEAQSSSRK